ncbi:MAG: RluA family pseudouridine synthase [Candidatus Babeliales bacterium]|jgi:23S rRNA pseudouridine1911/1915/1917 synthase
MEKMSTITVTDAGCVGTRIDKFLATQYPECSRSYLKTLIDDGLVLVNNIPCKGSYAVKMGDVLTITFRSKQIDLVPMPVDFDIIAMHPDFIIINKPAGLTVHPAPSSPGEVTLVHGLLHRFAEMQAFASDERPGIVHRLDKDTSGLLVIARNPQAQAALSALFKQHKMHKKYLAVVHKHPDRTGSIDLPIGRHAHERHKMGVFGIGARTALSHYRTLAYYAAHSLVEVAIVTGRTHQIRVHMATLGHPIVGDGVYGATSSLIKRQALHSWQLTFEYQGKSHHYTCSLPDDIKRVVQVLRCQNVR